MIDTKNILIINKDNNKIIYPTLLNSVSYENIDNITASANNIKCKIKKNSKIIFLLDDTIIDNHTYKLIFDIKVLHTTINQTIPIFIDVNNDNRNKLIIDITNDFRTINVDILINKTVLNMNNTFDVKTLLLFNTLNIYFDNENLLEIELRNIKLIKNDEYQEKNIYSVEDKIDNYMIYYYVPNQNKYHIYKEKIRYIFLKNVSEFRNKIFYLRPIYQLAIDKISPVNGIFLCGDVINKQRASGLSSYCTKLGKNRYHYSYECPSNFYHKWNISTEFLLNNFDNIYTTGELVSNPKSYWIPCHHYWFFEYDEHLVNYINDEKKYFMTNNPIRSSGYERDNIIKNIGKKCDFHFYGSNKHLIKIFKDRLINEELNNECYSLKKRKIFTEFKYILVFENTYSDGYVTEKMVDCLTCGSLPIYFGPKNVEKYFPNLFDNGIINGHNYTTDELLEKLNNMTNDEYNSRINKIISESKLIIDIFSEYTTLSLVLCRILSSLGINIKKTDAMKYIEKINKEVLGHV